MQLFHHPLPFHAPEGSRRPPRSPQKHPEKAHINHFFFFMFLFFVCRLFSVCFQILVCFFLEIVSSPRNPPRGGPQRRPPEETPKSPHGCSTVLTLLTLLRVLTLLRMCPPRPVPRKQPHITPHIYCTYLVRPGPPGGFRGRLKHSPTFIVGM